MMAVMNIVSRIERVKGWYEKNERRISTGSLVFGFVFDSLTLQRIDALRENLWIGFNMLLVGACIVLLNGKSYGEKAHFWLTNFLQFGFGAILGAFFIFYFRSATVAAAWPFLLLLLGVMVANELFQKRYARLAFQVSFFYLSILLFAIFLVPVLLGAIGPLVFLLSGVVSLVVLWVFLQVLRLYAGASLIKSKHMLIRGVLGILVAVNILYFTNAIPPIPLALKDAGVYHSVSRVSDAGYVVSGEEKGLLDYFRLYQEVHLTPGAPLYAYSAIFSPATLSTKVVHEWQYEDPHGDWQTASRIPLFVSGGREEGFRTYSTKSSLTAGRWRVNVSTVRGQLIGRINFHIELSEAHPSLEVTHK